MATSNKGLAQPANGSNINTWDVPVNGNFGIIDKAFGGVYSENLTGRTTTLNITSVNAENLIFALSGALVQNVSITLPLNSGATGIVGGQWIVRNVTTNTFTVTISPISGGGTSVVLPQGAITTIYSDGTNIRAVGSTADRFPAGGIMMWSGTIATIPTGWFLCNGSNGTPDLRDRFIVGARQDDAGVAKTNITGTLTQTGGNKDAIVVTHTHTATIASAGLHSHSYFPFGTGIGTGFGVAEAFAESQPERITASAGAHVHTATIDSAGASGDNANLPPYYALAYIMRGPY